MGKIWYGADKAEVTRKCREYIEAYRKGNAGGKDVEGAVKNISLINEYSAMWISTLSQQITSK